MRTEDGYIIRQCLDGNAAAFGFLVEKYKKAVYALAYSQVHNFHDAQDITQEVFIKVYRKLRALRHWDNFMGWLCRITTNVCKDWLRSRSRRPDCEFVEDQDPEMLDRPSMDFYREDTLYKSIQEALTRLKQEVPATMSATYERHELPATFAFRIVETVKSIRIHPVPRTAGLPWGLSVATGIIFTALCLNPQPSMLDHFAIGSPAPAVKDKNNGEMPVDVLEAPQLSILAGSQGDGDSLEPEHPDPQSASFAAAGGSGEEWIEGSASGKGGVVDPETGVKYTKTRAFSGNRDVITWDTWGLNLSPNGKFLLWNRTVIPLDDGEPFDLVDMPAESGIRSRWGLGDIRYGRRWLKCREAD